MHNAQIQSVCVCVYIHEVFVCTSRMCSKQARTISLAAFALCGVVFTFAVIYLAANMF